LASVVFTLIAFETLEQGDIASERLVEVATWTVFISVIAHGLTAGPLARWYGRKVADEPVEQVEGGTHQDPAVPRSLTVRGRPST
jgi:NhaP-type Na+/H+ or K+/H+ antiporter